MAKIEKLLRTALTYNASDLFLTSGSKPGLRINGDVILINEHPVVTKEEAESYLLEILSDARKKTLQDGDDLDFSIEFPGIANFRVNIFRQKSGLGGAFRLIPAKIPKFDTLKLPEHIKKLTELPRGLVLVTGPTGSGKSTTLASMIDIINEEKQKHIITIENPIEFIYTNKKSIVEQREVGTHTKSFASALKSSFRESPDVLLVGEMRDLETISLAITAAETGHLVFATLHTSGAAKSINRIIDVFPAAQQDQIRAQLSESLQSIIWQNLVKSADGKSRLPAVEILIQNAAVANLIRKGQTHQINNVLETHRKEGMQSMKRTLLEMAQEGKITKEEAMKHLPIDTQDEEE